MIIEYQHLQFVIIGFYVRSHNIFTIKSENTPQKICHKTRTSQSTRHPHGGGYSHPSAFVTAAELLRTAGINPATGQGDQATDVPTATFLSLRAAVNAAGINP